MEPGCPHRRAVHGTPSYDVDFYADEFIRNPFPHYSAMRALGPVVWLPRHGNYAVTQYKEAREVLQNWQVYSSAHGVAADDVGCAFLKGNTLASDPPIHDRMREAMGRPLLPDALRSIGSEVEEAAVGLVDDLVDRQTFDGIADLARFLPLAVVTQLVGLPEDGRENMLSWAAASFDILGIQNQRGQKGIETIKEMRHWIVTQAIPERLKQNSWTARIHDLVKTGDITSEIAPLLVRDYINPSLDTTISATGQLIYQLGKNPDQWQLLGKDSGLIPTAVNEAIRLGSPIRTFSRTVVRDSTLSGTSLPAGSRVMVLFASANRDERKFRNPDKFDVTRTDCAHIGFGHGIHSCVGMHLARLEMEALLKALLKRVDTIEVGEPTVALNNTIYGFASLPVSVRPAIASPLQFSPTNGPQHTSWMEVVVEKLRRPAPDVILMDLIPSAVDQLPPFKAGAHIDIEAAPGIVRQYSLCADPDDQSRYRIAVMKEPHSRGGSVAVHANVEIGKKWRIRRPRNLFELDETAHRTLLFAGGIGITPLLSMAYRLSNLQRDFILHYSARSRGEAIFLDELQQSSFAGKVRLHFSDEGSRLDMDEAFGAPDPNVHAYICGPLRFIDQLVSRARRDGWLDDHVHVERFGGEPSVAGKPFTVVADRSGKTLEIPDDKTILAVLREAGIDVPSSCESGVCATCLIDVLQGEVEHRDLVQTTEEKAANRKIAVCCSRARSRLLILDI